MTNYLKNSEYSEYLQIKTNSIDSINNLKKILNSNNIDIITLLYFIDMIFNLKN